MNTVDNNIKQRKYGLDVLKILMMFWILLFHMANHSQVDLNTAPVTASWIFEAFCRIGGGRRLLFCADYRLSIP